MTASPPLSVKQLEAVSVVDRLGSMSAAARALGVSQPFISKLVRGAEQRLGIVLFELREGKLRPGGEAAAILQEIRIIHARLESVMRKAENLSKGHEGRLRIAALPGFTTSIIPIAVAKFRASHPRVTFDIQTIVDADILPILDNYQADIVVGAASVSHERLETVPLGTAEIGIFYRREAKHYADRVSPRELEDIDLIGSPGMLSLIKASAPGLNLAREGKTTVGTNQIAAALVMHGFEAAIIDSISALDHDQALYGFSRLSPPITFEIRAFFASERPLSTPVRDFTEVLENVIA